MTTEAEHPALASDGPSLTDLKRDVAAAVEAARETILAVSHAHPRRPGAGLRGASRRRARGGDASPATATP